MPGPTADLFADDALQQPAGREQIGEQSYVLRGFALRWIERVLPELRHVLAQSPFRQMVTPGGFTMSAALSSCGDLGWTTDSTGYRYSPFDPRSQQPWPAMPVALRELAITAAAEAGFVDFLPDACLINRYIPGAKMSLHQDKNERRLSEPVVSVSLGLPAIFLFGGHERSAKAHRISLFHGDVVVWGGVDRLRFHGVMPIKDGTHPIMGPQRINLTFRTAG
ncbi:DNA oxidative demethylase AlkB [Pseudomonas syringae]|uniref:DNA oxidative demethylase AlkB n=1 Tax=Pseudomonas syringae TaxID=317 RepID=A0A9Q3X0K1_PSESX|nr:DNA oxidative demethylase AlkB [Pseudomonas syringae]MCF5062610.1 DNA oxidative demethylase AlkB [Pseudomonas syringae]MCF5074070.1 DNA oxidative demethylase AlkB [Pseudomonas syringae]MCF5118472.1 DNA oxidative demethylase AlkB [Pseudomonas syringae]MCF5379271.1 DNA oxidative demethylase AlkB [Pseudomonas syringae]